MPEPEPRGSLCADSRARLTSVHIKTILAVFLISRLAASWAGLRFIVRLDFHQFRSQSALLSSHLLQSSPISPHAAAIVYSSVGDCHQAVRSVIGHLHRIHFRGFLGLC